MAATFPLNEPLPGARAAVQVSWRDFFADARLQTVIATALANQAGRAADSFEFQMLYGVRPDEQRRLADRGHQMRVYIPYGEEWYGYLMRRMAERPANAMLFVRSLLSRG